MLQNMLHVKLEASLIYGGMLGLLVTLLGFNVSRLRMRYGVNLGGEMPPELVRASRAHGNAAEWVPLGIVLLLAIEVFGSGSRFTLHLLGGSFFLARVLHAAGVYGKNKLHFLGSFLTYVVLTVASCWAIALRFR